MTGIEYYDIGSFKLIIGNGSIYLPNYATAPKVIDSNGKEVDLDSFMNNNNYVTPVKDMWFTATDNAVATELDEITAINNTSYAIGKIDMTVDLTQIPKINKTTAVLTQQKK